MKKIITIVLVLIIITLILFSTIDKSNNTQGNIKSDTIEIIQLNREMIGVFDTNNGNINYGPLSIDSTVVFKLLGDQITAQGYFIYDNKKFEVSAIGKTRTYYADNQENLYVGNLEGTIEIEDNNWRIQVIYRALGEEELYSLVIIPNTPDMESCMLKIGTLVVKDEIMANYKLKE